MQSTPRTHTSRRVGLPILGALLAISLLACSQVPEPEENIESLTAVTKAPLPPDAATEYDIELHPDPVVEAMECSPLLVITARGTGEPHKGQLLSPVARAVKKSLPGETNLLDLNYPADTDVNEGGTYGVRLLLDTLRVQNAVCPDQLFALLGYSQGALVIGDALSLPEGRIVGGTVGQLSEKAADQIVAVVLYGNPRFTGTESYAIGTFDDTLGGVLPRMEGSLDPFSERIRDFCVVGDFICQSSLDLDEEGHVTYFKNGMQQEGADFVLAQFSAARAQALTNDLERLENLDLSESPGIAE